MTDEADDKHRANVHRQKAADHVRAAEILDPPRPVRWTNRDAMRAQARANFRAGLAGAVSDISVQLRNAERSAARLDSLGSPERVASLKAQLATAQKTLSDFDAANGA
jgi:hypothetical protein